MNSEKHKLLSGGGFLLIAMMISNFSNFVFNAFLGRTLSFEEFGFVTLYTTFWYLLSVLLNGLSTTVNHEVAYLAPIDANKAKRFYHHIAVRGLWIAMIGFLVWIVLIPITAKFFKVSNIMLLVPFAPIFICGVIASSGRGFLQGLLKFNTLAILVIVEAVSKLLFAVVFVFSGHPQLTYLSIPLSIAVSFMFTLVAVRSMAKPQKIENTKSEVFPRKFFLAALLSGLSSTAFLSLDVLLAKHFLSPLAAGQYSVLSLVGKMIYFFGSLLMMFMITLVSRAEGEKRNPTGIFYMLFSATAFLVLCGFVALGIFGSVTVPLLLGNKALAIVPYLPVYSLAIALFTLSTCIVQYRLARKQYTFSIVSIGISLLMVLFVLFKSRTVSDIAYDVFFASFLGFIALATMNFMQDSGRFVMRNFVDFMDLFYPLEQQKTFDEGKKRILVFNWRDTKHKFAGGAEVYVHELAKRWAAEGNHVTLFCGNDSHSSRYEVVDGVEVIRRGGFYFVYIWAFFYYFLKFRKQYDVIIDCQNGIPFFTSLYAKEKVFCLVFHIHQEVFRKYLPGPLALLAESLEKTVMPFAYKNATYVTISESTKSDMEKIGLVGSDIKIIYPGANLDNLKPADKDEIPTVLYLGRLKSYKSVDVLINAFKEVVDKIPNAQLLIAGAGEEEKNLRTLANKLNVSEKIHFLGKVTEEMKIELMQKAWVFVNPSYMEGWGITSIEANACGTPVVASDVPGLRDSVKNPHTGYLVEYGNAHSFADKILELLRDEEKREWMGKNSVEWASHFDWRISAGKLMEAF